MTNAELLALLREARSEVLALRADLDALKQTRKLSDLTDRIDAALAEAEKPVEWTVTEEGPCVVTTTVHGHFVEVAPTVKQGLWAWRIEPSDKRVRAKGTAPTLDEAKAAAIRAARGLS